MSVDSTPNTAAGLYTKLLIAQGAVEQAPKDSENKHQNYKYASADALVAIGKYALQVAGLSLVRTHWSIRPDAELLRSSNSSGKEVVVRPGVVSAKYLLIDGDTGEKLELENEAPYVPGAGRGEDKAVFASLTELYGYMMLGILCIERIDAPNVSGRDDSKYADDSPQRPQVRVHQSQQQSQLPPPRNGSGHSNGHDGDLGHCDYCNAPMRMGRSGKPYCHPCFVEWKERQDAAPSGNRRDY